jgi:hypothetical protein
MNLNFRFQPNLKQTFVKRKKALCLQLALLPHHRFQTLPSTPLLLHFCIQQFMDSLLLFAHLLHHTQGPHFPPSRCQTRPYSGQSNQFKIY